MANTSNGSGPWLAFLVGGLIVAVAVIGYFVYAGRQAAPDMAKSVNVDLNLPKMPEGPKLPDAPIPVPK
ncbi:hypothetical protein BH11PSE1_BH11PSE1_22730 [soil metagenome]